MSAPTDSQLLDIYTAAMESGYLSGLLAVGVNEESASASADAIGRVIASDPAHRDTILKHCRAILAHDDSPIEVHDVVSVEPQSKADAIESVMREQGRP